MPIPELPSEVQKEEGRVRKCTAMRKRRARCGRLGRCRRRRRGEERESNDRSNKTNSPHSLRFPSPRLASFLASTSAVASAIFSRWIRRGALAVGSRVKETSGPPGSGAHGSFFWLQNKEGLTLVGVFMEGTTLTCLKRHSDAKNKVLAGPRFR
jgi:hypothetical protein